MEHLFLCNLDGLFVSMFFIISSVFILLTDFWLLLFPRYNGVKMGPSSKISNFYFKCDFFLYIPYVISYLHYINQIGPSSCRFWAKRGYKRGLMNWKTNSENLDLIEHELYDLTGEKYKLMWASGLVFCLPSFFSETKVI